MVMQEELNKLRMLWGNYWSSRVLITANNFRVFDYLKLPKTSEQIAPTINADPRAIEMLLDALTGLGLLKKSSDRYRNTKTSTRFLCTDSPYYQGNIIKHADAIWRNWTELDEVIKSGKPARKFYDQEAFIRGMHDISKIKAAKIIKLMKFKNVKKALDLGGGPGTYSIEMAKKGVSVTLFDLPETIHVAKKIIEETGQGLSNLNFIEGDFLIDDIGADYDLIFISQILHAFSAKDNIKILKKSANALNKSGRLTIQEFIIDRTRTIPTKSALFSINMLVNTEGGRCYSSHEIKKWLYDAGLRNFTEAIFEDCLLLTGAFS
jgi:2-polyprenyl-3-methyl-5-hydroxy-6-metoxy-1,4-benzoquinol methylase